MRKTDVAAHIKRFFGQSLVRGGMRVMAVNAVGLALAYVSHIMIAKWLGVLNYGFYVYALAWLNVLTIIVQLGLNTSAVRLTAELRATNDRAAILGLSRFSTLVVLAVGLAVMVVGAAMLVGMSGFMAQGQRLTLAIMLPLVVVLSLLYQRIAILQGFEHVAGAQAFLEIVRPLVLIVVLAVAVMVVNATAALTMGINFAATITAFVLASLWTRRFLNHGNKGRMVREFRTHAWLKVSLSYLVIGVLTVVVSQSDVLILGTLSGGAAAGLYVPAVKLAQLILFPMMAMRSRAAPMMARLYTQGDKVGLQRQLNVTTLTATLSGLVLVIAVVWQRETVLGLFGPEFVKAAPALVVLAVGMMVFSVTGALEGFLIFGPFERMTVLIYSVTAVLNISLNLLFIPRFGVLGAAYATTATIIVRGLISVYVVWRKSGILPWRSMRKMSQAHVTEGWK